MEHFDVYYSKGSTAERDIDQIARSREEGHRRICEFIGLAATAGNLSGIPTVRSAGFGRLTSVSIVLVVTVEVLPEADAKGDRRARPDHHPAHIARKPM
jgi:hypothetical protein